MKRFASLMLCAAIFCMFDLPKANASGKALSRLRAVAASDALSIKLGWRRDKRRERGVFVQRSVSQSRGFRTIKRLSRTKANFTDTQGLAAGTTYYYRLKAVNIKGARGFSNTAYAKTKSSDPVSMDLIPAIRRVDWSAGTAVGVPGGIPTDRTHLIDATQSPYNADKSGASDASTAIQAALDAAVANDVVYLPAGTYRLDSGLRVGFVHGKYQDRITLRGAGMDQTTIDCRTQRCIEVGSESDYLWNLPSSGNSILSGLTKGSTQLTIADTSGFEVGQIVQITMEDDISLPVLHVSSYHNARRQKSRVTAVSPTTLSIYPPLYGDYSALRSRVNYARWQTEYFGLEDMTFDSSNGTTGFGVMFIQTYASWMKNVKVRHSSNYSVYISDSLNFEMRGSYLDELNHSGSNGAGLLFEGSCASLIEDNIMYKSFPHIEINFGSAGNVFAYNFAQENNVYGIMGASIDSNHGAHNAYNLFEGNIASVFESDGYFGSESEGTLFRNWFHATDDLTDQFGRTIQLNRFTRNYSIVGNVLGRVGTDVSTKRAYSFVYDNKNASGMYSGGSYGLRYIYTLGLPNVGNLGFNGKYVQPSMGTWWADWDAYLKADPGKGPGASGYQELDLDVPATTIIKANWNAADGAIRASEALGSGERLGDSMYLTGKPGWFKSLAWPPFDPNNPNLTYDAIPAGYRFLHGQNPPD